MIRRRALLILLLRLLLRCEKLLLRGELVQLELLLRCELLQIDGWQHERRCVVCAAGVDAGGRAVGRRLDISHDVNERSKAVYRPCTDRAWYKISKWARQGCNEVRAERADFWGVNAILGRVEGRKCNSRPGKRADTAKKRPKRAGWPPRRTRSDVRGVQRCHPLQVADESKRADRKRRRLYFYSRSAISRSAAHLETEETPLLLW